MVDKRLGSPSAGGGPGGLRGRGHHCSSRRTPTTPFVLTATRFEEFPNLWIAGPNFENLTKVSDANPQQAEYAWGRSELIQYLNADGKKLRAILTKPENFDPAKTYPLMVYIYEELTNGLHSYPRRRRARASTSPATSATATSFCSPTSSTPPATRVRRDQVRRPGRPRWSEWATSIRRVGIQGHSWGGYRITYLITRTTSSAPSRPARRWRT